MYVYIYMFPVMSRPQPQMLCASVPVPSQCQSSSADEIKASRVSFRASSCSEAMANPLITSIVWGIKGPEFSGFTWFYHAKGRSNRC